MEEILEDIKCNICGNGDSELFLAMEGFAYRRCKICGLVYQNPRPVFDELKKRYGENYFQYELSNQDNFFNLMKLGLKDIGFDDFYKEGVHGRRFLDIGCATGLLLNYLSKKGWEVYGVEICKESAEYAIRKFNLRIFIGTLEEASFPDDYFDVIHLSHLIEHVPDPISLLVEVRRIIKEDGHVILTTPNVDGFQARVSGSKWRSAIPDHIFLFSKRTMKSVLHRTGYRVIKQVSWGGIPVGKRPDFIKKPVDRIAKLLNIGDVMLFHCRPS